MPFIDDMLYIYIQLVHFKAGLTVLKKVLFLRTAV